MPLRISFDELKKKMETEEVGGLAFKSWKPKYGPDKAHPVKNIIKLFSWPLAGGEISHKVLMHFGLGSEGKIPAICPKTFGAKNPCPICDFCEEAGRGTDKSQMKIADRVRQGKRFLMFVADWTEYEESGKQEVLVFSASPTINQSIIMAVVNQQTDFTAWERSPLIELTGYQQKGEYPKLEFSIHLEKMAPKLVTLEESEWLAKQPDISKILKMPSIAHLTALLNGEDVSGNSDDQKEPEKVEEEDVFDAGRKDNEAQRAQEAVATPVTVTTPVQQATPAPTVVPPTAAVTPTPMPTPEAAPAAAPAPKRSLKDLIGKK